MRTEDHFYKGWQVGITYEALDEGGVKLPKMIRLLDEMEEHEMNLLSLMMTGYEFFSPGHDGFAWPVKNSRLECFRDMKCLNADIRTEFVSKVIDEAKKRGIGIQLFTNLAIYNPERIKVSYPGACEQMYKDGDRFKWLFCPDSDDVWQLENDEIEDLLTTYDQKNVHSIGYERLSYSGGSCYCENTKRLFNIETGLDMTDFNGGDEILENWKTESITKKMSELNRRIKALRPDMDVWLHSSCALGWGHDPKRLKSAGIDYVIPHIVHFPMTKQDLFSLLDHIAPNDIVLHFCVRNKALKNYNIWVKTPEIIKTIGEWIKEYMCDHSNLKGVLFFNENTVPEENREVVYELLKDLK